MEEYEKKPPEIVIGKMNLNGKSLWRNILWHNADKKINQDKKTAEPDLWNGN